MEKAPFVSVIIPFFNVAEYLAEAIESVLDQTFQDWELILADDGSTDGSSAIAQDYQQTYPDRILYIHHPRKANKGAAATRNLGVRKARGHYLALLDSDDKWMENKLTDQVQIATRYPEVGLICGPSIFWNTWSGRTERDVVEPVYYPNLTEAFFGQHPDLKTEKVLSVGLAPEDIILHPPFAAVLLYPLGDQSAPCPCSLLVKKEVAIALGGFVETFRGKMAFYEDQAFLIKIYLKESIYISGKACDYYRIRDGSVMSTSAGKRNYKMARYFFLRWFSGYLKAISFRDPMIEYNLRAAHYRLKYSRWEKIKDLVYIINK